MRKLTVICLLLAFIGVATAQTDFNPFKNEGAAATVSATHVSSVTPDDGCKTVAEPNRAIWVGGAGNLRVKTYAGETVTVSGVTAGTLLPLVIQCVYSTGTTATLIQVWW